MDMGTPSQTRTSIEHAAQFGVLVRERWKEYDRLQKSNSTRKGTRAFTSIFLSLLC